MSLNPNNDFQKETGNFLRMLRQLRLYEEVVLYANVPDISEREEKEALGFLKSEYDREVKEYPPGAPEFNPSAAVWSAKMIYRSAQLLLYREQKEVQLESMFPAYSGEENLSAILSADLTLRFLPSILEKLHEIDPEDALFPILEKFASEWDYSAIGSRVESTLPDFELAGKTPLLMKLYIDRIIAVNDQRLASNPMINREIRSALGLYTNELWKNFELIKTTTE